MNKLFILLAILVALPAHAWDAHGRKNRLSLLGGVGPTNSLTNISVSGSTVTIKDEYQPVWGAQYQRRTESLDGRLSVGGQYLSNKTGLLMLGLDF